MSEAERQDVIDRLRVHAGRIKSLMDLLGNKSLMNREEKTQAQEMMKSLKAALEAEDRSYTTVVWSA